MPHSGVLEGKVATITGATGGIGRAIAEAFVAEGASIVANGRNETRGKELLAALDVGDRAAFYEGSVLERSALDGLVDFTVEQFGTIDILVLNAGGSKTPTPVVDMPDELWDLMIGFNLTCAFWGMQRALRQMIPRRTGRIIVISSMLGKVGAPGQAAYAAAKHGLHGLVKSAALEVGEAQITVNAVCPGSVITDLFFAAAPDAIEHMGLSSVDELIEVSSQSAAIRRTVDPSEVASMCLYLASDSSAAVTGQAISVDGGRTPY